MRERVVFLDLLRCAAAISVIAIHVLAPFRHQFGELPFGEWFTAVATNGISRWAVPVFILISGALMLSDNRPFDLSYYIRRRLAKVLIPFLIWSLFYAYLSGWSASGFDADVARDVALNSIHHETYYHLGFFYYFIPLYFVIPLFQWLVKYQDNVTLYVITSIWLATTLLYLLGIDGIWYHELWLYSGYLPLGYVLWHKLPLNGRNVALAVVIGLLALTLTVYMVVMSSIAVERYSVGRWFSYKTLNVVAGASMVFLLCRYFAQDLSERTSQIIGFISQHSLGIYILHPLFLWPMKEFAWYQGNHPVWVIPIWVILSGSGALFTSWLLSRSVKTRWLLP